jgi:deoxyribonuclease-4
MIRFGPGGIPLSCKGRTLRDGLEDVHTLGLTAIEVQFVRVNLFERYVSENEIGLTSRDIENELVIQVTRKHKTKKGAESTMDPGLKLEHGDLLSILASGIVKDYRELAELKEISKELDIYFSIHTPYYMDLLGGGEITRKSIESIKWCGILANDIGAKVVVTHLGLYGKHSKNKALEKVIVNIRELRDWYKNHNISASLGIETSGKQEVFGDLDEILSVCKRVSGVVPVLNFAHMHARGNGNLKKKEDFQKIFDSSLKITKGGLYTHFSGVEYFNGNEKRYTPIKKGDLKFEPLAECILDNNVDITIISGSPLLEHDAMYMKVILERVLTRKEAKAMRAAAKKSTKAEAKKAKPKPKPKKPAKKKAKPKPKAKPKKAAKKKAKAKPKKTTKKKPKGKPKKKAKKKTKAKAKPKKATKKKPKGKPKKKAKKKPKAKAKKAVKKKAKTTKKKPKGKPKKTTKKKPKAKGRPKKAAKKKIKPKTKKTAKKKVKSKAKSKGKAKRKRGKSGGKKR